MDELSPKAEAKDMELVATRGEEGQGSVRSFPRQGETKESGLCPDECAAAGRSLSVEKGKAFFDGLKTGPFGVRSFAYVRSRGDHS